MTNRPAIIIIRQDHIVYERPRTKTIYSLVQPNPSFCPHPHPSTPPHEMTIWKLCAHPHTLSLLFTDSSQPASHPLYDPKRTCEMCYDDDVHLHTTRQPAAVSSTGQHSTASAGRLYMCVFGCARGGTIRELDQGLVGFRSTTTTTQEEGSEEVEDEG